MIIGDSVGKTSFLYRFCENKYKDQVPTIFETYSIEYEVNGQKKILRYSLYKQEVFEFLVDGLVGFCYDFQNLTLLT